MSCHSAQAGSSLSPEDRFVPDQSGNTQDYNRSLAALKAKAREGKFSRILENQLRRAMPPDGKLTPAQAADVQEYIESLKDAPSK